MVSASDLRYIITHVFLPPKLPQADDSNIKRDLALIKEFKEALESFQALLTEQEEWRWSGLVEMLSNMLELRGPSGDLVSEKVQIFLQRTKIGDVLAFHIRSQNAGLIVRRPSLEQFTFESFELSPTTSAVMTTKGRLRRCFPGPAIAVSHERIADDSFSEAFAQLLAELDSTTPLEAWPVTSKAGSKSPEIRDSIHPKFVTEMLTGILRGIGQPVDVPRINKRTRDDVLWDSTLQPWRRSPLWLLLRVALQTTLRTKALIDKWYKSFMIYFMAYMLQQALAASLPSDILFIMAAKISRRVLKLGVNDESPWMSYVHQTIEAANLELDNRWRTIEQNPDPFGTQSAWKSAKLSLDDDIHLSVSTLRPYLANMATREKMSSNQNAFTPDCAPRIKQCSTTFPQVCLLDADAAIFLADLELWVQDWLDDWLITNLDSPVACSLLDELIGKFISTGLSHYADNPENISLMLLTAMDLWMALDKCAIQHYPLLSRYNPGFPVALFNPLLLPKKSQMERLAHIEQYLAARKKASTHSSSLLFRDINKENSFGVQYFNQSSPHQKKRREIEAAARIEREEKKRELQRASARYSRLMRESHAMSCTYLTSQFDGHPYHCPQCLKCELKDTAEKLQISVHEWPLPEGELEKKSAVFELDVPIVIAKWRDTTYALLVDVFSPRMSHGYQRNSEKAYTLLNFSGLSKYAETQAGRLQLASVAKPFVVAHYGTKKVSQATEENLCVNNGLCYSMYDSESHKWTAELLDRCDVRKMCTFQLPSGSYKTLQYSLDETTHTSNDVLANQSECPKGLNLHEFHAFATLRSGDRLQWRNIARELVARVLNFAHEETYYLVVQAAWQVGRPRGGNIARESHPDLEEEEFGISLLSVLDEGLSAIEGNWQGVVAMRILVVLATRVLSLSSYSRVQGICYLFLRRARKVALQWIRDVAQQVQKSQDAEGLEILNLRALEMALVCHGTFDVDKQHLSALLGLKEDIADVTECSIIVHDRCPPTTDGLPGSLKAMLHRHWKLCHFLEPFLRKEILTDGHGIDIAIRRVWAGYRPGGDWVGIGSPSDRWISAETSSEGEYSAMVVHYNILDGSLLVNGLPLARLPNVYETHQTYSRLFGKKVLEVVPSSMPGMVFETRNEVCGQQVHFRMCGSELIIRTRKETEIHEVIPIHALHDDFPSAFVEDYAHWLDLNTKFIEWRPLKDRWMSSPANWKMISDDHQAFCLGRGVRRLIDIRSPTAIAISRTLSSLEHLTHMHLIFNTETGELEVNLPRLKLDFLLRKHQRLLESKQFRGMAVSECQSFGSFTGLVNKLVLQKVEGRSRSVIVPYGNISFSPDANHVLVTIDTGSAKNVKYHSYQIDSQLGRLVDNGSLTSRLFRLYLHATSSHCLVDHLTGRTGTEEALYGLASAATRSFVELKPLDIDLLGMLARLTPQRKYYPSHLRVMQQVKWRTLSPLSQHCDFYKQVSSILDQAKSLQIFQGEPAQPLILDARGEHDLHERAAIRDSSFQVCDFGAEAHTSNHDVPYSARDKLSDGEQELQACCTAKLVDEWSQNLSVCPRLLSEMESWGKPLRGPSLEDELMVGFDVKWLDPLKKFLPENWCLFQNVLSRSEVGKDKYRIMIFLSTLAYSEHAKQELVQTLLAFATIPKLRLVQPPQHSMFRLADGYEPVKGTLFANTENHVRPFNECDEYHLPTLHFEDISAANYRRQRAYQTAKDKQIDKFVEDLVAQWPEANISAPSVIKHGTYILVSDATASAIPHFQSWHRNDQFRKYVEKAQYILRDLTPQTQNLQPYSFSLPPEVYVPKRAYVNFEDLLINQPPSPPSLPTAYLGDLSGWIVENKKKDTDHSKLKELLVDISSRHSSGHEKRYTEDLFRSFEALQEDKPVELQHPKGLTERLEELLMQAKCDVDSAYQMICTQLQASTHVFVQKTQILPRLSPTSILSHLASGKVAGLPIDWKRSFVSYGLSIATLQRAERLLASATNIAELLSELENPGHEDWDPMSYPEWLLSEIENNILIRREQAQICREMMLPSSGSNSVMQLNMGQGKSSVIVPMAAVTLADGTQLVRVVVLKPLAMQMFHLLAKKLGGMLNRRIYYMPISRSLNLDTIQACRIRDLYQECMRTGGILLIQPEHILSFELMGLEKLISGNSELGNTLIQTQDWLQANSRDILDESDEILSVRFELVYTMGVQQPVEFSPDRWAVIQRVLGLVGRFAHEVLERFPHGLEIVPGQPGSFPRIRILQDLAGAELLEIIAREICKFGLPGIPVWNLPLTVRTALFRVLTDAELNATPIPLIGEAGITSDSIINSLLLLKGLFGNRILRFALEQKRWRVNYGLDPSRTMLAVPYHAKDNPATRAEFSHPDVTIVLTCLSYYYGGLSDQQIRSSFEALFQSDSASDEYARWVKDAPELPAPFRQITGINLSNEGQCSKEVFPPLRFSKGILNFYMSAIVFPAEMKEFPHKLSSSGWDIAREKVHPTTGFSGTNDSRYVLPLSVTQCDLPQQLSTNAKVLDCLLRRENTFVDIRQISDTGVLDGEVLLRMVLTLDPPVRVILDVGAQVLELQNEDMARTWLSRVPESTAQAVIFFNNQSELCVLNRDGTIESLFTSPFERQMDQCLVYLDEAHTRGTDLKMPENYRAIVTLGPGLTKDRLVQACMRMRKLGKGQSVAFCSSTEVQRKIIESSGKCGDATIEVSDILKWCIETTCAHTRKCIPLWATQGVRHQRRRLLLDHAEGGLPRHLAESLLEDEAQSLEQRYGSKGLHREEQDLLQTATDKSFKGREKQMADIRAKCQEFEVVSFDSATLHEEQERELSPENEREQQVELPPALSPYQHSVHRDVRQFVTQGVLDSTSDAFQPAFLTLRYTSAFKSCEATVWPDDILATTDFAQTVQIPGLSGGVLDSFLRPVQWVLTRKNGDGVRTKAVIISPYEAQELLPLIRQYKMVILHVYSPRLDLSARSLEDLSFCSVPAVPESWSIMPTIISQLNLFAGQLYIRNYEEYEALCSFLGLCSRPPDDGIEVACDGFINPTSRVKSESGSSMSMVRQSCPFMRSPVNFVRMIVTLRRKGQGFTTSHLGKILNGELILAEHFY